MTYEKTSFQGYMTQRDYAKWAELEAFIKIVTFQIIWCT